MHIFNSLELYLSKEIISTKEKSPLTDIGLKQFVEDAKKKNL
ncbi:hypothetical protein SAMN06265220_10867 [Flavobacterium nitrogenifigens]|uniref:Uncharacterized protein n=1 Tax=Flavobacterium nitrogenifigens TaxID=1617283 RepID=A0A521FB04_9FLAO|nr:hypothetical protein SAMN06265220_10867 [Flavobacterium nitrogenifigens]